MRWNIHATLENDTNKDSIGEIISILLTNRGISTKKDREQFIRPASPYELTPAAVGIAEKQLNLAIKRIQKAIKNKESIVVYTDYDADGITGGAILWETLHALKAHVMPYIPDREEEGYGLSVLGIDRVIKTYNPQLIITVDHGITAYEKVEYAKAKGIDVIVTDHHSFPETLPDAITVHTTQLSGSAVSWFLSYMLSGEKDDELVALAAIGTIADLIPLVGPTRSIVKYGLEALNRTKRIGLTALIDDAKLIYGQIDTYHISHILAPRINAMGRLEHGLTALQLLCTKRSQRAVELAQMLGLTNKRRQDMTEEAYEHARAAVSGLTGKKPKLLFLGHETYNPGIIGLVAGKLVEEYYLPAIVLSVDTVVCKASARSISGYNIVEAIREAADLLIDVGGHPMAAGFTVETKNLSLLEERLSRIVEENLNAELLDRKLSVDIEVPLRIVTENTWEKIRLLEPYGVGNPRPLLCTRNIQVLDIRLVGKDRKHIKCVVGDGQIALSAIGFGMGEWYGKVKKGDHIDLAYTMDLNIWNGSKEMQLKIRDIQRTTDY